MKPLVNISIDDVSPHPQSGVGVLKQCHRLLEHHPDAFFTLFVPVSYWRTMGPTATEKPLQIDMFPEFCQALRDLPKENFEVCYHGFHHGIPGKSNNDEFQHLNCAQAGQLFDAMFQVVKRAGLEDVFKPVFRPPAWRMSPGSFDAAKKSGIEILALSPDDYARRTYLAADDVFDRVVYYTSSPPWRPLVLAERTEIVYHACLWDHNLFSDAAVDDLLDLFKDREIEFVSISGLVSDERCPTCHLRHESAPWCSNGFHLCKVCEWVEGRRVNVCARCEAIENGKI